MNLSDFHRVSHLLFKKRLFRLAKILVRVQWLIFNSYVPASAMIGKGTKFAYGGIGVVVHDRAVIGRDCVIGQNVTIGGRSNIEGVPVIEDGVYVGAGARILGDIKVGAGSVIGANAVVIRDVPPASIVVGVPAKVIKTGIVARDFY